MISTKLDKLYKHLAFLALGALFIGPTLATAAALSISQVPLFITIALPPNITVLLDDSGSMQWGHVPDWLGSGGTATVFVTNLSPSSSTPTATVVVTGPVTTTATPTSTCVQSHHSCSGTYTYSCSSGYTLTGASTGTTSTPPSGDTCRKITYTYSCPSGYTLNGSSTGSTSTAPSTTTCQGAVIYSCPTGDSSSGSGSSTTCSGYETFTATIDIPNDTSSGGVYAPDTNHYKCACYNPLAYNPSLTYTPGYNDTGTAALTTSFTAAYVNPYNTSLGTINISTSYEATVDYNPSTSATTFTDSTNQAHHAALNNDQDEQNSCNGNFTQSGSSTPVCQTVHNPQAAFYYVYTASNSGCSGVVTDDRCMTKVVVSATSGPSNTDERQNFANWYSFYRTRNLTTNTSANIAFTGLNSSYRVAWRDLNTCSSFAASGCKGWSSTSYDNRIAIFTGTHRQNFFDWLTQYPASGGTPLRAGLQSIGKYYSTPAGVSSPYAFNPQVTDSPEYVCRANYAVIMTDGLWNDGSSPSPSVNNADGTATTLPDGTTFATKTYPYYDTTSSTLADVAFYYWANNLRPDLGTSSALQYMPYTSNATVTDNHSNTATMIPYWNPQNDPASWPHMVTFTIGLGLTSTITSPAWGGSTYSGGYDNLVTSNIAWPVTSSNSSNNVYDLWHAAIDSRGQFFSVDNPADVQAAFNTIVNRIQGRTGSASAVAVNSTHLNSNSFIYQAQFNSSNWTGDVKAYAFNPDGSIATTATWQASANIPAPASRNILTWNESLNSGAKFLWANLNTAEQTSLNTSLENQVDGNGSLRLNYLRGDQSDEQSNAGIFRIRSNVLGDIVNSNPQYVGTQDFGFDTNAMSEGSTYESFVSGKANRTDPYMLYVGGNDGMLHGINACPTSGCGAGTEVFDYVPRGVYANLSALTDPLYTHEYYVDGSPSSVDAYVNNAWATLLVGATGAGAKDVFLLDVTDASNMTGTKVLWDYDGVDGTVSGTGYTSSGSASSISLPDPDIGYTIGQPTIARMHDGDWYAIFGNGDNSTNQQAVIYLYNINTKTLYKYSTGTGSIGAPNGMSSLAPVDYDADRITDAIYAGDLQGNLWKLDVSGSTPASWHFVTYGNSTATPLFTGHDSSGNIQPITDQPQVGRDSSDRVMVYFGTGTYFLAADNSVGSNPPVMSFYGIIDDQGTAATDQVKGTSITDRSELLQQYIVTTDTINGTNYRITTSYPMTSTDKGWFVDLNYPVAQGERVVSNGVLDLGRIVFPTLIPEGNACQFGGESFLMELSSSNGGALPFSPFDTNGNGLVNNQDMVTVTYTDPVSGQSVTTTMAVSGVGFNGIIGTPAITTCGTQQCKGIGKSDATMGSLPEAGGTTSSRISWQQLQ